MQQRQPRECLWSQHVSQAQPAQASLYSIQTKQQQITGKTIRHSKQIVQRHQQKEGIVVST